MVNDNCITIYHQNVESLKNKIEQLEVLLYNDNVDFACIGEHWFEDSKKEIAIIEGYTYCTGVGRTVMKKGGSAIYCRKDLIKYVRETGFVKNYFEEQIFECCAIQVLGYSANLIILAIYRSPSSNIDSFFKKLDEVLSKLCRYKASKIILAGDLNVDFFVDGEKNKDLLNLLKTYGLKNHVDEFTRIKNGSASSIDYVCSNFPNDGFVKCEVSHNGLADHSAQICQFVINKEVKDSTTYARSLTEQNYVTFLTLVKSEDWSQVYTGVTVNECYSRFMGIFTYYINVSFPLKKCTSPKKCPTKPWLTKGILIASRNMKMLYKDMISSNSPEKVAFYKRYKSIYKKIIRMSKKKFNDNYYADADNKSRAAWNIINKSILYQKKCQTQISTLITENGLLENDKEIASYFNDFFVNIPIELNDKLPKDLPKPHLPYNGHCDTMYIGPVSEMEVYTIIKKLGNSNAAGIDEINAKMLKLTAEFIVVPLTFLINMCLKVAKVIPVYKKDEKDNVENYRSISLLSVVSKILERVIYDKIVGFLVRFKILNTAQHSFIKGKSTMTAIYSFIEDYTPI